MKTVKISLNSIDKVKSFVNDITKFDVDFDLVSGRYVIDAKSIMGIFSLDLSKPIDLNIHADNDVETIQPIVVNNAPLIVFFVSIFAFGAIVNNNFILTYININDIINLIKL